MANPTTNYGFVLPTPTDLVTDLPADFDIALQGVDTRLKALQPGTTAGDLAYSSATANTNVRLGIGTAGQVLAVVSGVPAWATTADQTPLTTKGDLFSFTTVDARLAVGANGETLVADSSQATGLKYQRPAFNHIQTTTFTAAATLNISSVFSSTFENYRVVCNMKGTTADATVTLRMLTGTTTQDTSSNYFGNYTEINPAAGTSVVGSNAASAMTLGSIDTNAGFYFATVFEFMGPNLASTTNTVFQASVLNAGGSFAGRTGNFQLNTGTQYTGFCLLASTGNLEGGTVRVYGYNNG